MHRLASLSLANRALIALVTAAIAFFGVLSMTSLKQELIPSVTLPIVSVTTTLPGASPQVVDEDVSRPIEAVMQGLEGLEGTTTTSSANLSIVSVEFRYGTDLVYAQQRMQVALNRIQDTLPDAATTNIVAGSIDDFPVLQLAIVGGDTDDVANLIRLETLGDLLEIEGVRDATLSGAPSPRIAITPNPTLMATFGVTSQTISDTLDASGALIPIGQLTEGDETLTVQAGALLTGAEDIAALPLVGVSNAGQPLTIGEVAAVEQDAEPVTSISRVNGEEALTISITKTPDANTVAVSNAVVDAIPDMQAKLGADVELIVVFDQAPFVEQSIDTLVVEGLLGLAFAVVVIFVFLLSVRATLVTAVSIPTSLLVTFIGLQAADYSLNILTLGALTIAIGRVVDDSIVVIENITRHMTIHQSAKRRGTERIAIIVEAVREVAGAITASTISTVAVFLPIAFVSDISGELFRPFALTSVIALLASLVVSLTIVPVLAYWLLGGAKVKAVGARAGGEAGERAGRFGRLGGSRDRVATAGAGAAGGAAMAGALGSRGQGGDPDAPGRVTTMVAPAGGPAGDGTSDSAGTEPPRDPLGRGTSDALRRDRPADARAAADRDLFSPLGLRDTDESAKSPADSSASTTSATFPPEEGGAWARPIEGVGTVLPPMPPPPPPPPARSRSIAGTPADGADAPELPAELTPERLRHDPESGEITISRRELRELREKYGDETVDAALDAASRAGAAAAADGDRSAGDGSTDTAGDGLHEQPEQQQQSRDEEPSPFDVANDAVRYRGDVEGGPTRPALDATGAADATSAANATGAAEATGAADATGASRAGRASRNGEAEPDAATQAGDPVLEDEPRTWLQRLYDPVLAWTLRRPVVTLVAALLILVLTGLLVPLMKTNFLGEAGGNTFTVTQSLPANTSLAARDEAAQVVEDTLIATEGIETVQLTISGGGGIFAAFGGGGSAATARFSVITSDGADVAELQETVRAELESVAEGEISVGAGGGGGFSSDLTVEVAAPTSDALTQASNQITEALAGAEGIVEVSNSLDETRPFVQLDVDAATAAQYGLSEFAIGGIVAQQMQPLPIGDIVIAGESVSVYVLGSGEPPQSLDELQDLAIPTALGPQPLSTVATIEVVDGPVSIRAERGTPTATVTVVPESEDLSSVNALVQETLDGLDLPVGATAELGGVSADQAAAFEQLGLALLAAILIVYIVMVATFKSLLQPFLLLVSIPFAATGAVLLQLATGVPLGVSSIIGVLMLVGIVVTNAIVLIDLVNQFRARGHDVYAALVHGGSRRVRPIVMTALATIFALIPMALGITGHSGFISQPLALTVIGGLLSSTVLTLLVLPALYSVVEGPRERRRKRRQERAEAELAAAGLG